MSFRISISGMNAASQDLNITSNNIANVNTTGFKQSRAEFGDLFAVSAYGLSNVATGAGSTGWLSSVFNMAEGLGAPHVDPRFPWEANQLRFAVREPYRSPGTQADLVYGELGPGEDQQVGAVAAQPRGQVIQPEQAVEALGVLLVALQPVDERQLLIDEGTTAPRHGLEHVVDQQSQPGLVAGQQQRLAVQLVDRMGNLADLLGGVHR